MKNLYDYDLISVGAHPDDVEVGTGGLLIDLCERGYKCGIVILTQGEMGTGGNAEIRARVAKAISGVLANQGPSGGFGMWFPGGDNLWLNAYVTDFLTRASGKGYSVPAAAFQQALDNLRMKIYEHEITALLGHNGAGKSTTMNMLTGMIRGRVCVCVIICLSI